MNILNEIKKNLKKFKIYKLIDLNTEFKLLGLDSLDLMDLIIKIEKKYNIKIPDDKLYDIKIVKDLIKIIENIKK